MFVRFYLIKQSGDERRTRLFTGRLGMFIYPFCSFLAGLIARKVLDLRLKSNYFQSTLAVYVSRRDHRPTYAVLTQA